MDTELTPKVPSKTAIDVMMTVFLVFYCYFS